MCTKQLACGFLFQFFSFICSCIQVLRHHSIASPRNPSKKVGAVPQRTISPNHSHPTQLRLAGRRPENKFLGMLRVRFVVSYWGKTVKDTVVNLRRQQEARKNKFDSSCGFVVMLRDFRVDLTVTYLSVRKAIATKGFCRVGVRFVETWTCSVRVVSLFVKIIFELLKQRYKSKSRRHRTRTEQISFNFIKPCASGPPITDLEG